MPNAQRLMAAGLAVLLLSSAALAQNAGEPAAPAQPPESNLSRIEKALTDYVQRAFDLFTTTFGTLVPYEAPEVLPNGDIIIRRVPDAGRGSGGAGTPDGPASPPAAPSGKDGDGLKT